LLLELQFSLIEYELDHYARNECQGNGNHEHKVVGTGSVFNVYILLVDRERLIDQVEFKLRITSGNSKNCLEHVLGEHDGRILRGAIQIVDDVVQMQVFVRIEDLVGTISVGEERQFVAVFVHSVKVLRIIHRCRINKVHVKRFSRIRERCCELSTCYVPPITSHVLRVFIHDNSLLVGIEASAQGSRGRLVQFSWSRLKI
jgi:hypothetical protein